MKRKIAEFIKKSYTNGIMAAFLLLIKIIFDIIMDRTSFGEKYFGIVLFFVIIIFTVIIVAKPLSEAYLTNDEESESMYRKRAKKYIISIFTIVTIISIYTYIFIRANSR